MSSAATNLCIKCVNKFYERKSSRNGVLEIPANLKCFYVVMCDQRFAFFKTFFPLLLRLLVKIHVRSVFSSFAYFFHQFSIEPIECVCVFIFFCSTLANAIEDRKLYVIFWILKRFLQHELTATTTKNIKEREKTTIQWYIQCYKMRDDTISVMFERKTCDLFRACQLPFYVLFASSASFWLNINDSQSKIHVGFSHRQFEFIVFFSLHLPPFSIIGILY